MFIPLSGRGHHNEIVSRMHSALLQLCLLSQSFSDSQWEWESKASEVPGRADLIQQGSAIFSQFAGCLCAVGKGWHIWCCDAWKKAAQHLPGSLEIGFYVVSTQWECCHFCSWDWADLTTGGKKKKDKDSYETTWISSYSIYNFLKSPD